MISKNIFGQKWHMARSLSRNFALDSSLPHYWQNILTCWGETVSVSVTKTWTVLARCHPRSQSRVSEGDGPSVSAADGLWSVLWSVSVFLLPIVSDPDSLAASTTNNNAPDGSHMKHHTTVWYVRQLRQGSVRRLDFGFQKQQPKEKHWDNTSIETPLTQFEYINKNWQIPPSERKPANKNRRSVTLFVSLLAAISCYRSCFNEVVSDSVCFWAPEKLSQVTTTSSLSLSLLRHSSCGFHLCPHDGSQLGR